MNRTQRRLTVLAVLGTMGSVAPVAGASAAVTPAALPFAGLPVPHLTGTGLGFPVSGFPAAAPLLTFPALGLGQAATVIGPTIITTAPSMFINTNNQVTAGSAVSGGQVAAP